MHVEYDFFHSIQQTALDSHLSMEYMEILAPVRHYYTREMFCIYITDF